VGGINYQRTVLNALRSLRGGGPSRHEKSKMMKLLRNDSFMYEEVENWCSDYFTSLMCHDPSTGLKQVDWTDGNKNTSSLNKLFKTPKE
jgi:hypothetical protein